MADTNNLLRQIESLPPAEDAAALRVHATAHGLSNHVHTVTGSLDHLPGYLQTVQRGKPELVYGPSAEKFELQGVPDSPRLRQQPTSATVPHNVVAPHADFQEGSRPQFGALPARSLEQTQGQFSRDLLKSGAGYGAITGVAAAAAAGTVLSLSGASVPAALTYAAAAGAGTAVSGLLTGASLYGMGYIHNALWGNTGAKRPGVLGTCARGLVAPVTIPAGIIWNAFRR